MLIGISLLAFSAGKLYAGCYYTPKFYIADPLEEVLPAMWCSVQSHFVYPLTNKHKFLMLKMKIMS